MKISKICIKGYKSIMDLTLELRNINVLIGSNGIGKSNFVSAFELLHEVYEKNLQKYVIEHGGADAMLYMGPKVTNEIKLEVLFSEAKIATYPYNLVLSYSTGDLHIKSLRYEYNKNDKMVYKIENTNTREFEGAPFVPEEYYGPILKELGVYHFHDTGLKSPMKGRRKVDDNKFLKADGENIAPYLYYLSKRHPKRFALIESMVHSVAPFFGGFCLEPDRINPELIRLEWKQANGGDAYFNEFQLSDGTLRFICLATLLMQPEPPQVIIIDEPELGLHPQAINKLAAMIKRASATSQIIISTQSNQLIDYFEPEDVIVAEHKDDATTLKRLNSEDLNVWLEEYSLGEIWEKNIIGGQPL